MSYYFSSQLNIFNSTILFILLISVIYSLAVPSVAENYGSLPRN